MAVDIGANQVGEIATVALLEETDQLLGKNHLFKRSLLLIKVIHKKYENLTLNQSIHGTLETDPYYNKTSFCCLIYTVMVGVRESGLHGEQHALEDN